MKYNKRLEKIILPEKGSKLKFKKTNHMIKWFIHNIFYIETYAKYLGKKQIKK